MLSNLQKASISALLCIMDGDIELTRYNIKKAKNSSIYNIKSKNGKLNHYIDFVKDENVDEVFRDVVRQVYNKRIGADHPIEYFSDNFSINCIVDIINEYTNLDITNLTNADEMQANFDRLGDVVDNLTTLYAAQCNYSTKEPIFIQMIGDLCEEIRTYIMSGEKMSYGTLFDTLENFETAATNNLKNHIANEHAKWVFEKDKQSINSLINKHRAKILTMAILSRDINPGIFLATRFDNTLGVSMKPADPQYNNKAFDTFFHNKKHSELDMIKFREDFCNLFLDIRGFDKLKSSPLPQKESVVFECIKEDHSNSSIIDKNINELKANDLFDSYLDVLGKINYGDDQTLYSAIVLNIACTQGKTNISHDLSNLESFTAEEVFKIFNLNYDIVKENPTAALQAINNLKRHRQETSSSELNDFINFLNSKKTGSIFSLDISNPDNIPPPLQNMLEDLGILPNPNGDEPELYDPDKDIDNPNM